MERKEHCCGQCGHYKKGKKIEYRGRCFTIGLCNAPTSDWVFLRGGYANGSSVALSFEGFLCDSFAGIKSAKPETDNG